MAKQRGHSVFDEPQYSGDPHQRDPSEKKAERILKRETRRGGGSSDELQSVHQEPAIFPKDEAGWYERPWSCSHCGYNLQGRRLNEPCPCCGRSERYRPTDPSLGGYAGWVAQKLSQRRSGGGWLLSVGCIIPGGLFAVVGALFENTLHGGAIALSALVVAVAVAPAVEETLKIALPALIVERRPYLFSAPGQIYLAALGAAALFSAIENLLYLYVFLPNAPPWLAVWRWTVCLALHGGCTAVAASGLVRVWRVTVTELRPPVLGFGLRRLVAAAAMHGLYNASAFLYETFARH